MAIPQILGVHCALSLAFVAVPVAAQCPTVKRVQNCTDGALTPSGFCDEVTGEGEATVIRSIPAGDLPIQIVRIGVGWRGTTPGFTQAENALHVLPDDPLGMIFGPTPLYTYLNPVVTEGVIWVECVSLNDCPVGTAYCFGDGTGTACPCGNTGQSRRGCENSFATGGGRLEAHGVASVTPDSLHLRGPHLPPTSSALFFQGLLPVNGGLGNPFGDGLLCVTGSVLRMGTNFATGGEVDFGYGVTGDPLVHDAGGIPPGGGSREYQIWYRNAIAYCTSATYNLSNAVTLTWSP